ncbi:MAG: hypothetical protein MHM6MM_003700 [Cercozoa sp. M6MM]
MICAFRRVWRQRRCASGGAVHAGPFFQTPLDAPLFSGIRDYLDLEFVQLATTVLDTECIVSKSASARRRQQKFQQNCNALVASLEDGRSAFKTHPTVLHRQVEPFDAELAKLDHKDLGKLAQEPGFFSKLYFGDQPPEGERKRRCLLTLADVILRRGIQANQSRTSFGFFLRVLEQLDKSGWTPTDQVQLFTDLSTLVRQHNALAFNEFQNSMKKQIKQEREKEIERTRQQEGVRNAAMALQSGLIDFSMHLRKRHGTALVLPPRVLHVFLRPLLARGDVDALRRMAYQHAFGTDEDFDPSAPYNYGDLALMLGTGTQILDALEMVLGTPEKERPHNWRDTAELLLNTLVHRLSVVRDGEIRNEKALDTKVLRERLRRLGISSCVVPEGKLKTQQRQAVLSHLTDRTKSARNVSVSLTHMLIMREEFDDWCDQSEKKANGKPIVLIDGANVAHGGNWPIPNLYLLTSVLLALRKAGTVPLVVLTLGTYKWIKSSALDLAPYLGVSEADAIKSVDALEEHPNFFILPPEDRRVDDAYVVRALARKPHWMAMSNDKFRDWFGATERLYAAWCVQQASTLENPASIEQHAARIASDLVSDISSRMLRVLPKLRPRAGFQRTQSDTTMHTYDITPANAMLPFLSLRMSKDEWALAYESDEGQRNFLILDTSKLRLGVTDTLSCCCCCCCESGSGREQKQSIDVADEYKTVLDALREITVKLEYIGDLDQFAVKAASKRNQAPSRTRRCAFSVSPQ